MKKIIFIFIYLFLIAINSYSQLDTTTLSLYTLHTGNYWEYKEIREQLPPLYPGITIRYFSQGVMGDTILPNLKKYKIIRIKKSGNLHYKYERIDTLNYNVFRYHHNAPGKEYLIDSLKAQEGDTSRATRIGFVPNSNGGSICFEILQDTVLGKITIIKKFRHLIPWSAGDIHHLSSGLGLNYSFNPKMYEEYTTYLKYAVINGVEYGTPVITGVKKKGSMINTFQLFQNYPNPFNSTTIIPFELSQRSKVKITIYDVTGRKIKILVSSDFSKGVHKVNWNGTNQAGKQISSGVYIYNLKAITNNKTYSKSAKLVLLQ